MNELYIKELLSVVQRNYTKSEVHQPPYLITRTEDMLICVLEGESVYSISGRTVYLHAGDVLLLPQDTTYTRVISDESYRTVFVYFRFDGTTEPTLFSTVEGIELGFMRLYKKWSDHAIAYMSECMGLLYGLYAQLLRTCAAEYLPHLKRELFESATSRMSEQSITVSELAREAGMSEVHFRRCFKRIYGVSPQEYMISSRLRLAKELLQYESCSVEEVSRAAGFCDAGYFTRLFKSKTGYTPTEYRSIFK